MRTKASQAERTPCRRRALFVCSYFHATALMPLLFTNFLRRNVYSFFLHFNHFDSLFTQIGILFSLCTGYFSIQVQL